MASITIRNLDGDVKNRLRVGATRNGRAMEEEPRLSLQQRPHHQQVVAPDELIPPARPEGVALIALVGVEERHRLALLRLARGAALIDGLDDLEGQTDAWYLLESAVLVVLTGPDQLGLVDLDFRHLL